MKQITQQNRADFYNKTGYMGADSEIANWLTFVNEDPLLTTQPILVEANPNIEPTHYTSMSISPLEYIEANQAALPWAIGNVIKYVSRYKAKNGIEDLLKSRWYLNHQIALEEALLKDINEAI